jgi:hypothetical protein
VVGNDWCVRWRGRWLQIDARHAALNLPGRKVTVKQRGDGVLLVLGGGQRLTFAELRARPVRAGQRKPVVNNRRYKPAATHPWNRGPADRVAAPRWTPAPATPARGSNAEKRKAG